MAATTLSAFLESFSRTLAGRLDTPAHDALCVACAALRDLRRDRGARPVQICVIGPTQVGKSTIVNSLLGIPAAEVSPLAGFTVHAQAFAPPGDTSWADDLIPGFHRTSAAGLRRDDLDAYAVTQVPATAPELSGCVVWDTPDFDSLQSGSYHRSLLEIVALADVVVMVVSKEKYSDLSVANTLRLLAPLDRPLLLALNKLAPESAALVEDSLRQRLSEIHHALVRAPIIQAMIQPTRASRLDDDACQRIRDATRQLIDGARPAARAKGLTRLIQLHWPAWTMPIRAEHAALQEWRSLVEHALASLLIAYRRDYLDHPQRYDTFRRATVELLELLELPGVGGALSQIRKVVTWPARQLFAARQAWQINRRSRDGLPRVLGNEEQALFDAVDRMLVSLLRDAARRESSSSPAGVVWRAISERLETEESALRARFHTAAREYRTHFEPEVTGAANRLYQTLTNHPNLLNSLRAARATADAASILLAIKTGGISINELLLAPALFGVTSMLTEGALGTYMERVAADLKKRQAERIEQELIRGVFQPELSAIARRIEGAGVSRIRPEELENAEAALDTLSRDLHG